MYTPHDENIFCNAFAGAYTAITNGERRITSPHDADYEKEANVAFAIAEEFDTVWFGAGPANSYELNAILLGCYGQWLQRPPTSLNPLSYAVDCNAILAMVLEGEAVLNAGGIIPPSPGGSESPLVRTRWIDGDTSTVAANQTGAAGAPYKTLTNWIAAIGVGSSAADSQTLEVALVSPANTGYTENPAFPAFRNIEVRAEGEPIINTGNAVWHNSVAGGGTNPPTSFASVKWTNWGTTGSFTCTDDGSVVSLLIFENNDSGPILLAPFSSLDITGCTAVNGVLFLGFVSGSCLSTANATGAIVEATNNATLGNTTCKSLICQDATLSGTAYVVADGSSSELVRCLFSNGAPNFASATAAGATVQMDRSTYQNFLELGGTLTHITLIVAPTQDMLFAPTDVAPAAVINVAHGAPNFHSFDLTGAQPTVNLDTVPTTGQRYRAKNSGVGATKALINARGGFAIEQYGNQGNYSGANGQAQFAGAGQGEVCEWVFNAALTVGGVTGVWEIAFTS